MMRSVPLPVLVRGSSRIVIVTALDAESHIEELGRRRRVVTDTRVRVEESVAKAETKESELIVRTLGGSVGSLGEIVHGQARLVLGEPCLSFLLQGPEGLHYVNGMAQGHYPVRGGALRTLAASPDLPEIVNFSESAVKELVGQRMSSAATRIRALVSR